MPLIYLIAGEQSGDILGGRLMAALTRARPGVIFAGIGGAAMADQGLTSLFPMRELALMGLLEVLPNIRRLSRRLDQTVAEPQMQTELLHKGTQQLRIRILNADGVPGPWGTPQQFEGKRELPWWLLGLPLLFLL